jgi:hypothetical protein
MIHQTGFMNFGEGEYAYPVNCSFSYPPTSKSDLIDFIVDLHGPEMKNINDGNVTCGKTIYVQFTATDVAGISYYNYSVYDSNNSMILPWTNTTSASFSLTIDNLVYGRTYYFKANAVDILGQPGINTIASSGFKALDPNSAICLNDNSPPTITVKKECKSTGTEATIVCSDNLGCGNISYNSLNTGQTCTPSKIYTNPLLFNKTMLLCWKAFDVVGNIAQGSEIINVTDSDGDGVPDCFDACPNTPYEALVTSVGCSPEQFNITPIKNVTPITNITDSDGDGVPDYLDKCPDTPESERSMVDSDGCSPTQKTKDSDQDGVPDYIDKCPDTSVDERQDVDADGCGPSQRDKDKDGIPDINDKCPNTPSGEQADSNGCSDSQRFSCNDAIPDSWRKKYFGAVKCDGDGAADADPDKDGLTNLQEFNYGTNPNLSDTDGDGFTDGQEVKAGTNPLDAASIPTELKTAPLILLIIGILLVLAGIIDFIFLLYKKKEQKEKIKIGIGISPEEKAISEARMRAVEEQRRAQEMALRNLEEERRQRAAKIKEAKKMRRERFFEKFGKAPESMEKEEEFEAKEMPAVQKGEAAVKKAAKGKKSDLEFVRTAEMTEERIKEKAPLIKITRAPIKEREEFERLRNIVEGRLEERKVKSKREISNKERVELENLFSRLSEFSEKREAKKPMEGLKRLIERRKAAEEGDVFKELGRISGRKKTEKPFEELGKLTKKPLRKIKKIKRNKKK